MTADRYRAAEASGGWVALSDRAKFRLTGADRVRYLNGQVTNDVRKTSATAALHACVVNARGRIEGDVFIHADPSGEALYLDAEPALRESLAARLEKYIVADDVVLSDVTDEWGLTHVFGAAADSPGAQGWAGPASTGARVIQSHRFGMPGQDIWVRGADLTVRISTAMELSAAELETWRICHGIPRWPAELGQDAFPQEAGLESSAMDFAKGCYIGQEVLSRIKMSGKMPRVLRRVRASSPETPLLPGMRLVAPQGSGDPQEAGTVTSATRHPLLDRMVGLAYVRQALQGVDSLLLAGGDPPRIFGDVEITSA